MSKISLFLAGLVGVVLLAASIFSALYDANQLSTRVYLLFRVEMDKALGYTLVNPGAIDRVNQLLSFQYLGFAFLLSGVLWISRRQILVAFKPMHHWIEVKNTLSKLR
jgi:hypothetical protein